MRKALKVSALFIVVWSIIFTNRGDVEASSILMSNYTTNGVVDTSAYFGSSEMSIMTNTVLDGGKNQVTFVQSFDNLTQMLEYDAIWVQRRDRYTNPENNNYSGSLTNMEINNIQAFIATGRKVVMFGEWGSSPSNSSLGWTSWNNQILGIVGGSYDEDEPAAINPVTTLDHPLTAGVAALSPSGYGTALGGAPLFQPNIATLWDDNVLTILDTGVFLNVRWDISDNGTFGTNVARWITSINPLLSITKQGPGTGDVFSTPPGISCGLTCSAPFVTSTGVTLTAEANTGSHFDAWAGCDFNNANFCFLTIAGDRSVTATFALNNYTLTATKIGTGSGTLSALGLSCISDSCTGTYPYNTQVTITATPATNSTFTTWSGCDSSNGNTCTVTMSDDRSISASFTLKNYTLTVGKSGTGTGTVTGTGINCGSDCTENYTHGNVVTLTATADTGSGFTSWSGCDSTNANICTVSITATKSVSATFTLNTYSLTAAKSGTGSGSLTAPGLSCNGNTCTGTYDYNETVHITATADTGSVFTGWSGCDSVNGNVCSILINGDKNITATFYLEYALLVNLEGTGDGRVVSTPSGIDCEPTCSDTFLIGTPVTLMAYPYGGSAFAYWSGACTGASPTCEVTMTSYVEVTAHFVPDETKEYKLTIGKKRINKGDGLVQSDDGTISCGEVCTGLYYPNALITLRATPSPGSIFEGWTPTSLNCGTSPTCGFIMDTKHSIKATFRGPYRLLAKIKTKNDGSGSVIADISGIGTGINCPASSCEDYYPYGNNVALTAQPGGGSQFIGWKPAFLGCGTSLTCTVPMTKKQSVTATFEGM